MHFIEILEQRMIKCAFQPILSLRDGSVFGYEALSRGPQNTPYESPEKLIQLAGKYDKALELEYLFRHKALEAAKALPAGSKLFLNVNPNIIQDKRFSTGFTQAYLK